MPVDDSVIAALEAAVTASPESRAVRLHLGGVLTHLVQSAARLNSLSSRSYDPQ